jgi:hypothetical protein
MQRNNNKPLTYTDDVLKEALRKSDFDPTKYLTYEKSLDAIKTMFEYITFETKQHEVYAIELPKIGTLYRSLPLLKNKTRDEQGIIENQVKTLQYFCDENGIKSFHNKIPLAWSYHKPIKEKFEIYKNTRMMSKINLEVITATEKLQNK